MKYLRILALMLAAMLCLTACSADSGEEKTENTPVPQSADSETVADEPEATAPADTSGVASNEAFLITSLAMPYESWMTENMYSMFAATFFLDLGYVDAFDVTAISTEQGVPDVYVGELEGDNYGNGMNLALFYTHPETAEITMINATVYLKTGLFDGYMTENAGDPAAIMEGFIEDGTLKEYHHVSYEEFMSAYAAINQIMNEAATGAAAQ